MDLVIVSHMARSWVQNNQVFSKHANVYFHYQQQCVQKKTQPYFQANVHCFIPDEIMPFLRREHKLYLYNKTLASFKLYYMGNRFSKFGFKLDFK